MHHLLPRYLFVLRRRFDHCVDNFSNDTQSVEQPKALIVVHLRFGHQTQQLAQRSFQALRAAALANEPEQLGHLAVASYVGGKGFHFG